MYQKEFDPHYLVDNHLMYMLKLTGINTAGITISEIYIIVLNPDGEVIYG